MKIETMAVGPIMTNCYLLCDEESKVCAVIDPGEEGDRVAQWVEKSGCALQYILLTHGHYDHYTGVEALLRHYPDTPVYIHPNDAVESVSSPWSLKFPRLGESNQRWYGEGDELALGKLAAGAHTLELTLLGNRHNGFGPIHLADPKHDWIGPNAWRTSGPKWTESYRLKTLGITTAPRVSETL